MYFEVNHHYIAQYIRDCARVRHGLWWWIRDVLRVY